MRIRILLLAAVAGMAAFATSPASADPACAEAQASGLFLVEHVGPVCVATPLPTSAHTVTVGNGVESVSVTATTP